MNTEINMESLDGFSRGWLMVLTVKFKIGRPIPNIMVLTVKFKIGCPIPNIMVLTVKFMIMRLISNICKLLAVKFQYDKH